MSVYRIHLFGELTVEHGDRVISRFRTYKTGSLLAYLAFYLGRAHSREFLTELFWPNDELEASRNSLSKAISSLRNQLEPPGVPSGAAIVADRANIQLNSNLVSTDVREFEALIRASRSTALTSDPRSRLEKAAEIYRGDLVPSIYEDWTSIERQRLLESYISVLNELSNLSYAEGDHTEARQFALKAVAADPLREQSYSDLIALCIRDGDTSAAMHHYRDLELVLRQQLDSEPNPALQQLVAPYMVSTTAKSTGSKPSSFANKNSKKPVELKLVDVSPKSGNVAYQIELVAQQQVIDAEPSSFSSSLPLHLTRFFGREDEIQKLAESLVSGNEEHSDRLWTLSGTGGIGKSRLSVEIARRLATTGNVGVAFTALADISDPRHILSAIADSLNIVRLPAADLFEQVVDVVSKRPFVLILDNFEQLLGSDNHANPEHSGLPIPTAIVHRLLTHAPNLKCLVTSRQKLGIKGEREIPLAPLAMPEISSEPVSVARFESVQLFTDRAQAVRPDFQITPGNAEAVARLCARLEGLPLAIELAAARSQVLTPSQMLLQLDRSIDFLSTRQRHYAPRHRTIRAAIEWSYDLLSEELRQFWHAISVFHGSWSAEAAQEICNEPMALDQLALLVECSIVVADESRESIRFRQLETLRQFGDERLGMEDRNSLQQRHAQYYCQLSERIRPSLTGPEAKSWLVQMDQEQENFRAALSYSAEAEEHIEIGLRLVESLAYYWNFYGHGAEAIQFCEVILNRVRSSDVPGDKLAGAWLTLGGLQRAQGNFDMARTALNKGLILARSVSDTSRIAIGLHQLSLLEISQDNHELASQLLDEGLLLCRSSGDTRGLASILTNLGILAADSGNLMEADQHFAESLALHRQFGDKQKVATLLTNLGNVATLRGDGDAAHRLFNESLSLQRELGDKWGIAATLNGLGRQALEQRDYIAASPLLQECLELFRELGDRHAIAASLYSLGIAAFMQGTPSAKSLLTESLTLCWQLGDKSGIAYSLEGLARMAAKSKHPERAACLWGVAESLRELSLTPLAPAERSTLDVAVEAARNSIQADAFQAAWSQGRALDIESAIELVTSD